MTLATIIMIVLICVGCALGLAGLAVAGYHGYRAYKAAKKVGITSRKDLDEIALHMREIDRRTRELQKKQEVVAERLRSLSATTNELRYLKDEIDRSTGYLSKLKS